MLKSFERVKKLKKERYKVPKSVQDIIPFDFLYRDGTFQKGMKSTGNNMYSKTFKFTDVNFLNASDEECEAFFLAYVDILNSFDSLTLSKITINNRTMDIKKFSNESLLKYKKEEWNKYVNHYNNMILRNSSSNNNIMQEKYITVTIFKESYEEAKSTFIRIYTDLKLRFEKINSRVTELEAYDRLKIFHDFYRGIDEDFVFDFNDTSKKGYSFKDHIVPHDTIFHNKYFQMDKRYGRVMYLKDYPNAIADTFVSAFCNLNKNMMYSMDFLTIPPAEARDEVDHRAFGIEKNIADWQRKQNMNNNFSAVVPFTMEQQRKDLNTVLEHLTNNDQRMLLSSMTVVHLADSLEELNNDTEHLTSVGQTHGCNFEPLYLPSRQLKGLNTVLPYFDNFTDIYRTLLSYSAAAFIPFRSQEIMQKGGIWYGQNKLTNNPIICNKTALKNCNSLTLGVPGAGKSFLTKEEIEFLALGTDDDIIILDPEGEYDPVVQAFGGEIIKVTAKGKHHINAMDMTIGYGDTDNPIADKSQFIMSLFEQLDPYAQGISAIDRSIIDRCVYLTYDRARKQHKTPTLINLFEILNEQPEEAARDLAIRLELCATGSFDTFAHETNVNIENRIVSYNLFHLGKQQKAIGLLVITDTIINKVNVNFRKGKKTHVFIDEIHVIFENRESAAFFSSAWRQFRKRNAYPTGITQNISYLLQSDQINSIVSNTEFFVILDQAATDRDKLAHLLQISPEQMNHVTNAAPGTGLIKFGPTLVPFVNEMPKGPLYSLNTTNPQDKEMMFGKV